MKIPRNAPCPCGSGKKYKTCCLLSGGSDVGQQAMQEIMASVHEFIGGREFSSMEELQAELDGYMGQQNLAPVAKFHGLSSEQMHRLLHFPFDSPDIVRFATDLTALVEAPVLTLFSLLVEAIGEKGLTPTAKGNLPRRFCRESACAFRGEDKYAENTRYGRIRTEMDFFDMHCLRLIAGLAGLARKYKGKFVVTGKCRKMMAAGGVGAVYFDLFKAYITKFNWPYRYGSQEIRIIQQAALFSLFLLSKFGGKERPVSFYEDTFLEAFPAVLDEVDVVSYRTVEETIRSTYSYLTIFDFAKYFGLVERRVISVDKIGLEQYSIKKTALLDRFIAFNL